MARRNSFFSIIILVVLLLGLGIFYLTTKKPSPGITNRIKLFPWLGDDITVLQRWVNLTNTLEYTAFQREGDKWQMIFPVKDQVHPELFHRLIETLGKLQSEQSFVVTNEEAWKSFGFAPYQYRFIISNRAGNAYTLEVGSISVGQNYYYVRVNGTETNYQVYTFNLIDLTQPQGAYRWPDIFDISFDSLERVEFFFQGKRVVVLTTNVTSWELIYPEKRSLTNFSVTSILLDFYPIQADHFITTSVSPTVLRQYELLSPLYGVIFIGSGRSNTLWISAKGENGFRYAYSYEREGVFVVSESEVTTKWITQASQLRR